MLFLWLILLTIKILAMKKVSLLTTPAYNLGHVSFYQFVTAQASRIKALGDTVLTDADMRQMVVVLLALANDFNQVILQVQKSLKTDDVVTRDRVRDVSVAALKLGVKNATYSTVDDEIRAAAGLTILLDTYGDIAHMPLDKETGAIDKLIADLEGPTYKPMVEKIGLTAKVTRLKTDNNAFKTPYDARRDDDIASDGTKAIDVRKQVNEQYQLLCDYVLLKAKLSDGVQYAESLQIINTIRKEYLDMVARSKGNVVEDVKKAADKKAGDVAKG